MPMRYTVTPRDASRGEDGELKLAAGNGLSMRLWERVPAETRKEPHTAPYSYVGYALEGRARLFINGEEFALGPGDSYLVPAETLHHFVIHEDFTAVEVTNQER